MNRFFTITIAGLLMSCVGSSIAFADGNPSDVLDKEKAASNSDSETKTKSVADILSIGFESPGIATTTAGENFKYYGVESFANLKPGVQNFDTNYGTGGMIVGGYTDLGIKYASSIDGGSYTKLTEEELIKQGEDASKSPSLFAYAAAHSSIDLKLSTKDGQGIDYLGFFMPTIDQTGQVTFYRKGVQVASVSGDQLLKGLSENDGKDAKGVFINIFDKNGNFDEVKFSDTGDGQGFFTSDHTVGRFENGVDGAGKSGGDVGGVPEPATWTMMIIGVGLIGGALRRRRATGLAAVAA